MDWIDAGLGYAGARHALDRHRAEILEGISDIENRKLEMRRQEEEERRIQRNMDDGTSIDVHVSIDEDERGIRPVNALDFSTVDMPESWDDYIGQGPLKRQIFVAMESARLRNAPFPHTVFASGYPGVGKTTMARLIAKTMGVQIIELVPPFNIYTLVEAAEQLNDRDILFIDEIHKLADHRKSGAEILLKVLEDRVAFLPDGTVVPLANITVIGATTDKDVLPDPVLDRFKLDPYFQPYTHVELARIAAVFAVRHDCLAQIDPLVGAAIAMACRDTPRIAEKMVEAARDLAFTFGRNCTDRELLQFLEVEPDGLTRTHIHYLTALYQFFARTSKSEGIEYVAGEATMQQLLRETKQGIGRVERFLIERGLIDRRPYGRRLTPEGIERAQEFVDAGKGGSHVG